MDSVASDSARLSFIEDIAASGALETVVDLLRFFLSRFLFGRLSNTSITCAVGVTDRV
mgnify:FL=1